MSTNSHNENMLWAIPEHDFNALSPAVVRVNNHSGEFSALGTGMITSLRTMGFDEAQTLSYMDGMPGIKPNEEIIRTLDVGLDHPLVLTNAHVIEGAHRVTVETHEKISFETHVVFCEPHLDLALLYISDLTRAKGQLKMMSFIPDTNEITTGTRVCAIGMPHGLDFTYTMGSISHVNADATGISMIPAFQTDTEINPGNSGGPLIVFGSDPENEEMLMPFIIGINTFIHTGDGYTNTGLNFSLRITEALDIIYRYIINQKNYIIDIAGIELRTVNSFDQEAFELESQSGLIVTRVNPTSPYKNFLKVRDVIIGVDDVPVRKSFDLSSYTYLKENDNFSLTVSRQGKVIKGDIHRPKIAVKPSHLINPLQRVLHAEFMEYHGGGIMIIGIDLSSRLNQTGVGEGSIITDVESATERHKMIKIENLEHFYELCAAHGRKFYQVNIKSTGSAGYPISFANDFFNEE